MIVLVSYDVSTLTPEGRKRLRQVAKVCLNYGQRVQYSVFECQVDLMKLAKLKSNLLRIIDLEEDSLRIYRIIEPVELNREEFGKNRAIDFEGPLVI